MADEWEMSTEYYPENVTDFFNETDMGNSTEVATVAPLNFLDSFVKSLSVILVSEIGDKTFFLAGINAAVEILVALNPVLIQCLAI
jgi:hypothetical protein